MYLVNKTLEVSDVTAVDLDLAQLDFLLVKFFKIDRLHSEHKANVSFRYLCLN